MDSEKFFKASLSLEECCARLNRMKRFGVLLSLILFSMVLPATMAFACITKAKKMILPGTSLEKNPVVVRGDQIVFDVGTPNQVVLSYNLEKKMWCPSVAEIGCLRAEGKSGQVKMMGTGAVDDLYIDNENGIYAKIEIVGNKLRIYPSDKQKAKYTSDFLEVTDQSDKDFAHVRVTSKSGAEVVSQQRKGLRGIAQTTVEQDAVNMSKSGTTTVGGCGSSGSTGPILSPDLESKMPKASE